MITTEKGKKMSIILKGRHLNPDYEWQKGFHCSIKTEFKKGMVPWNKGKSADPIVIEKMRATKLSQNLKGSKSHSWKGGKVIIEGYYFIKTHTHPFRSKGNYYAEHRLVMEAYISRYLLPKESVHHINGNKLDNRIENLMLFPSESEHQKYHHKIKKLTCDLPDQNYFQLVEKVNCS